MASSITTHTRVIERCTGCTKKVFLVLLHNQEERSMTTTLQNTRLHSSEGKFSPQSSPVSSVEELAFDESVRWYKKRVISALACFLHPYPTCIRVWECLCWVQVIENVQPVQRSLAVQEGVGLRIRTFPCRHLVQVFLHFHRCDRMNQV